MGVETKWEQDEIYHTLIKELEKIADDFDLKLNRWCRPPNTIGRLYLNRTDRSAICFIEENNSKHWVDNNIGIKLKEVIDKAFNKYSNSYNDWYKRFEEANASYLSTKED